jgi:N-acyl-D-aspartate/D-glutamate deacylase
LNELRRPEKLRVLRRADVRERILAEFEHLLSNPQASPPSRQRNFELVFPMGAAMNYEPRVSDSIAAMARATGKSAHQVFYDQLLEGDGTAIFYSPIFNFAEGNYEACREMLSSDATVPGLGDAGAHVGSICDASFTTYLLSYWGRDRPHGRFDLPWLVKRLSADTARAVGLSDRGVVAPNMKADMNVIDFPRLRLNRPEIVYDLPAKGRRLIQSASGYDATIVSGSIIRQHGEPTHNLPGRLVRSNRHAKV